MTAVILDSQAKLDAYAAAIDVKKGYPKDGVDIGAGIHASKAQSRTLRHALGFKHPTLPQYAYPDGDVGAAEGVALPVGAIVQVLDTTWTPVVVIGVAEDKL